MLHKRLASLQSAIELHDCTAQELEEIAAEIRDVLCNLLSIRTAHFASNLGVVELCLALHSVYDFRRDRLIWDTGHQIYPHKLITGRYADFHTIRTRGGLMGYPNPAESEYDLFMTGHAGSSVSTALGLKSGDDLMGQFDRHSVAVIGDGAFPSGIVFEALNNAGGLGKNFLVVLNDNKMSICPRVGGVASYLDRLRTTEFYAGLKSEVTRILGKVPLFGDPAERFLAQLKEAAKAGLHGGMMFEELGFRYIGPVDGHNLPLLKKYLQMAKKMEGPVLLHVLTVKGQGYQPAAADPVYFHTPPAFADEGGKAVVKSKSGGKAFTNYASESIERVMAANERVTVLTAAMCQGNKLEPVRARFPDRFFDVGICESHAVAFAAGQAKAGLRPIVDIYSTFLQRSYDQIFQEVALQNLPVAFLMDRAGLTGPDGPTHHGIYDVGYMRVFPNLVVAAPGDGADLERMVDFAVEHEGPVALRYPKADAVVIDQPREPVRLGKAEVLRRGEDGAILCYGALLPDCLAAAEALAREGLHATVVNARFVKPLDRDTIGELLRELPFVITVEEGALHAGFGSAVLELAADEQIPARVVRLGLPDEYIQHGDREAILDELDLSPRGIADRFRSLAQSERFDAAPVR
ncbi:MAG TPA: 1-deoxy-D-xylulose-5-phosphate synthase [Pirellulaceae bacterium]|jgi:1-deoxy-D-xylulose-5-phosphate synthase|nr:1-deoxy-D-xylulose-5-phosphate synthase [Pirellulaceae bacterium]